MAMDEQAKQNQKIAESRGISSLVFFGIFVLIIIVMISNAPGGWAWGYGIVHLLFGFVVVLIGVILAIRGISKHSKSVLSIVGLTLNGIAIVCLLPIAPLGSKIIGESFSSGKPSPTDRAWYLMESNRAKIIEALPAENQNSAKATFYFLEGMVTKINKSDAKEIEDIVKTYINEAGKISDLERSQKVLGSLKSIENRYNQLKPAYNKTFGPPQQ